MEIGSERLKIMNLAKLNLTSDRSSILELLINSSSRLKQATILFFRNTQILKLNIEQAILSKRISLIL